MKFFSRHVSFALVPLALGLLTSVVAPPAEAQQPGLAQASQMSNVAKASALFDEGRARWSKDQFAEACKLFSDSEKLDHSMSALYFVGRCHEHFGRLASAWGAYVRVVDEARRLGKQAQEAEARARAEGVKPKLPMLTITIPRSVSETEGFVVWQDGERVPPEVWNNPVPVDPGEHLVVAQAVGKLSWSGRVTAQEAKRSTIDVPTMEDAPMSTGETAALALGAVALAGVVTGTVFGLRADATWSDALDVCGDPTDHCDPASFDRASSLEDDARTQATIATVGFAAGGAALAVATYLWVVDSDDVAPMSEGTVTVAPTLSEGQWGLGLVGRF